MRASVARSSEFLIADPAGIVTKADLNENFKRHLDAIGKTRIQQGRMLDGVQTLFPQSREVKVRFNGTQHHSVRGIRFRKDSDDGDLQDPEQGPGSGGPTGHAPILHPMLQRCSNLQRRWSTPQQQSPLVAGRKIPSMLQCANYYSKTPPVETEEVLGDTIETVPG